MKDLIAARLADGPAAALRRRRRAASTDLDSDRPRVQFTDGGTAQTLDADVVAGCDGFHGVCRPTIETALTVFEHTYPFAWLGILAHTHPSSKELVYASHDNGFALHSMRTPDVTRQYLQVAPDEDIDRLAGRAHLARAEHADCTTTTASTWRSARSSTRA